MGEFYRETKENLGEKHLSDKKKSRSQYTFPSFVSHRGGEYKGKRRENKVPL